MRSQLVVVRVRMTEKNLLLGRKQRGIRELMKESMSQKRIQKIPEITIISVLQIWRQMMKIHKTVIH